MPQIRCPNCGTSINLETRKEMDEYLILKSLRKEQKTFTQLLRESRLPRKTLSLRLKELIESGVVVKDGGYSLSESSHAKNMWKGLNLKKYRFIKENLEGKRNALVLMSLLAFLVVPYFATSLVSANSNLFTVKIKVYGAVDLYAWQAKVIFDPSVLAIVNVAQGGFLSSDTLTINSTIISIPPREEVEIFEGESIFVFNTRVGYGAMLIGETRLAKSPGVSGDGTLATITFSIRKGAGIFHPYIESSVLLKYVFPSTLASTDGALAIET